jgi:hypothetical protein
MTNGEQASFTRALRGSCVAVGVAMAAASSFSTAGCKKADPAGVTPDAPSTAAAAVPEKTPQVAGSPAPVAASAPLAVPSSAKPALSATPHVSGAAPRASGAASGSAARPGSPGEPQEIGDFFADGGLGLKGIGEGGGCPCRCDQSEQMVDDLRSEGRPEAIAAIESSLRTIGEREDAGYITDRMVQHRLRLVAYGEELGRKGPSRFTVFPAVHGVVAGRSGAGLMVVAQPFMHGESTEIVNGKEKPLRTSFVVRLSLENGGADVELARPTLESSVPLPVSRWYVAGTNGEPWDGALRSGEKKTVHLIGYAGEPVDPGTEVTGMIKIESLTLPLKVRARKRWDRPI